MGDIFRSAWAKLSTFILAYFAPIQVVIHCMLIFIVLDCLSGIWASMKEGNKIESHKLRKTVIKLMWYTVAVMAAHMMETSFHLGWSQLSNITGGFICLIELKSIFENIARITNEPVFRKIIKIFTKKMNVTVKETTEILDVEDEKTINS
jgi:phage-related holin